MCHVMQFPKRLVPSRGALSFLSLLDNTEVGEGLPGRRVDIGVRRMSLRTFVVKLEVGGRAGPGQASTRQQKAINSRRPRKEIFFLYRHLLFPTHRPTDLLSLVSTEDVPFSSR